MAKRESPASSVYRIVGNLRMMATIVGVAESDTPGKTAICIWCDTTLDPVVPHIGRVCSRCYRLLKLAGITEDEIFARDGWKFGVDASDDRQGLIAPKPETKA